MNPLKICPECGGYGWVREFKFVEGTYRLRDVECTTCNRTGFVLSTNADRIRAMSDEELASEMNQRSISTICDIVCQGDCKAIATLNKTSGEVCKEIIMKWLQQPAEEDT